MGALVWGVLVFLLAGAALPIGYFIWRSIGKSLTWRFSPGWSRLTHEAAMERYPCTDGTGLVLAYEAIPEHRFVVRVRELDSGSLREFGQEGVHCRFPQVSLDGTRLRYREFRHGFWHDPGFRRESRLVEVALSSSLLADTEVTAAWECSDPQRSADGRRRVSSKPGADGQHVWVADGGLGRMVDLGPGFRPVISASGRYVAFERVEDAYDLLVVDLETDRQAVVLRGNPYPNSSAFMGSQSALVVTCGHLNPLSRTGDTDLFKIRLEDLPARKWKEFPLVWQEAEAQQEQAPVARSSPRGDVPKNSVWVAGWYFDEGGQPKTMAQQDRDGIEVYSRRLAEYIDKVRRATGAPRVNLVCHCMGGLVAKGMIQYWHEGEYGFSGLDGTPGHSKVLHLVTLASPLRGNSLFGLLPAVRALRIPYYRFGFTRQAYDMTRGSEFLARVNQGPEWRASYPGNPGSCYKPEGKNQPPYYHSFTGNGYGFMDGAVTHDATVCKGLPHSDVLLAADEEAIAYETVDGAWTTDAGQGQVRRFVHVPEDVVGRFVTEDKSKALTAWILGNLDPDVPLVFVHGSYLFRGFADLSWRVVTHRLTGEVPGWPARYRRGIGGDHETK